jgi:hypothetical protein
VPSRRPAAGCSRTTGTAGGSHVHCGTDRQAGQPALPLRPRHGYAAGIHRGLPPGDFNPGQEFPARDEERVRAAIQPISAGFELADTLLRDFRTLVPLVCLPASLARPAPSSSTGTPCRCRGCFRPPRRLPGQAAPSFTRPLRRPGGEGLPPPLGNTAPRGARSRRSRPCSALLRSCR